jgi:UDP-glucose 4-epimerase
VLLFGRAVDTSRLAREFDWTPRYSTREAVLDFARGGGASGPLSPERVTAWERRLHELLQLRALATGGG